MWQRMEDSVGGKVLGLATGTPLQVTDLDWFEDDGLSYAVDAAAPNWIVVEPAGRHLLEIIASHDGSITFGALVARYAGERQGEAGETPGPGPPPPPAAPAGGRPPRRPAPARP